jgi:hypothetical protein
VDLNHNDQMGARTDLVGDQALPATHHVDVALTPFDRDLDDLGSEIGAPLTSPLVLPAGVAERGPCKCDPPASPIGCAPHDGAESPMLVMDPTLSINSH